MDDTLNPVNNYSKISLYFAIGIVCFHLVWLVIYLILFAIIFPDYGLDGFSQLFFVDFIHQSIDDYILLLLPISLQIIVITLAIIFYNKENYKFSLGLTLLVIANSLFGILHLLI